MTPLNDRVMRASTHKKSLPMWQAFFVGEYPGHLHAAAALLLVSQ